MVWILCILPTLASQNRQNQQLLDWRHHIPEHRVMRNCSILPTDLNAELLYIGAQLMEGRRICRDISHTPELLAALDPADLSRAESAIVTAASLYHRRSELSVIDKLLRTTVSDADQLARVDGLEYVFIFHKDGRLREAALRKICGPLPNALIFTAIAWRLNDWAAPVRNAAVDCARRTFPDTSGEIIARAAMILLTRQATWGRWNAEREVLNQAMSRRDVASCLANIFATRTTGPVASLLRQTLRFESMDEHLDYLATSAVQPAVRATATQSLVCGHNEWPSGWRWRWIDKSMGIRRRETEFARRPLTIPVDRSRLIRRGLKDRAATVRKTAMSGLIRNEADIADARQLASVMLTDTSAAVRERAEFLINRNLP